MSKKFIKITESQLKRIMESQLNEGFFEDNFGEPDVDRAFRDSKRATGVAGRGRKDQNYGESPKDEYVIFQGQEFHPRNIQYASYDDLGEIPRIENGKLIVTNPAWEL